MKIHTTRTAQFIPSSPKQDVLPGQKGQHVAPPNYGLDFADNPNLSIQPVMDSRQQATPASLPPPNNTGLPGPLKAGVEQLSGHSLDDVQVHYNSPKPAQLHALAYAQGTDIHIGPGQEKHLPHEAWHVVQQKQGRVRPTRQMKGVNLNDDVGLEKEADVMGGKAMQFVGNRSEALLQGKLHEVVNNYSEKYFQFTSDSIIQRTVDTAAEELHGRGMKTVKKSDLKGKFAKEHGISVTDLKAIQTALDGLRAAAGPVVQVVPPDMTDNANWPVGQYGMVEGDGATVAATLGWDAAGSKSDWGCSDPAHSPNGKVYKDGQNNYFGADNTGHVGWGFKVWLKKDNKTLDYAGNYFWNGNAWVHHDRGTKRSMK